MGRSGYSDDCDDNWALIRWRGAVNQAIRGRRGQALLRELLAALDAMPTKRLIDQELVDGCGEFCALGALGAQRGFDLAKIDTGNWTQMAEQFGVSKALVREIMFINDGEYEWDAFTPEQRWVAVRRWVASQIKPDAQPCQSPK